jgi:hypothetical protein
MAFEPLLGEKREVGSMRIGWKGYVKAIKVAGLLLGLSSLAHGQALMTYYADDLERVPGVIYVSKGFNTVLQFYDKMDVYALSRQEIVQVQELSPSTLFFTTTNIQGMTGLTVVINGRVLNFSVVVRPGDHNRTYRVEPSRFVYGTTGVFTQESAPSREKSGGDAREERAEVRASPLTEAEFSLVSADERRALINFTIRNASSGEIYLDVARLAIAQGGRRVSFTITRTPARIRLAPGETQTGTMTVSLVSPSAPLVLEWTVTSSKGRGEVIRRTIPLVQK